MHNIEKNVLPKNRQDYRDRYLDGLGYLGQDSWEDEIGGKAGCLPCLPECKVPASLAGLARLSQRFFSGLSARAGRVCQFRKQQGSRKFFCFRAMPEKEEGASLFEEARSREPGFQDAIPLPGLNVSSAVRSGA